MNLAEFTKLKEEVENLKRQEAKAQGALGQLQSQLKKEFGCATIKEAKKLQLKLEKELEKAEKEYEVALKEFRNKWKDKLEDEE